MSLSKKCVQTLLDTHVTEKDKIKLGVMLIKSKYTWAHVAIYVRVINLNFSMERYFTKWLEILCYVDERVTMLPHQMLHYSFYTLYWYGEPDNQVISFSFDNDKITYCFGDHYQLKFAKQICNLPEKVKQASYVPSITSLDDFMDIVVPHCECLLEILINLKGDVQKSYQLVY